MCDEKGELHFRYAVGIRPVIQLLILEGGLEPVSALILCDMARDPPNKRDSFSLSCVSCLPRWTLLSIAFGTYTVTNQVISGIN